MPLYKQTPLNRGSLERNPELLGATSRFTGISEVKTSRSSKAYVEGDFLEEGLAGASTWAIPMLSCASFLLPTVEPVWEKAIAMGMRPLFSKDLRDALSEDGMVIECVYLCLFLRFFVRF